MKVIVGYIVILAYSWQLLYVAAIFVDFKINQDFIAKVLCINQDKPDMGCNGQCHLKKEVSETERNQNEAPQNIRNKQQVELPSNTSVHLKNTKTSVLKLSWIYQNPLYKSQSAEDVFHPPKFTSL